MHINYDYAVRIRHNEEEAVINHKLNSFLSLTFLIFSSAYALMLMILTTTVNFLLFVICSKCFLNARVPFIINHDQWWFIECQIVLWPSIAFPPQNFFESYKIRAQFIHVSCGLEIPIKTKLPVILCDSRLII